MMVFRLAKEGRLTLNVAALSLWLGQVESEPGTNTHPSLLPQHEFIVTRCLMLL